MIDRSHNEYLPDVVSPPGETLRELLEDRGMSQAELAERTGRPKKTINEIIKGKAAITPETAIQFERVLGAPASFWINRESAYRENLARREERRALAEYLPWMKKFPIRAMIKLGWLSEREDPLSQLEEFLQFLGVASPVQWQTLLEGIQWRQSPTFAADPAAVSVWLRKGEIEAGKINCAPYNEKQFQAALQTVRGLTTQAPDVFITELARFCAQAGVAVVFVPEIPGTRTSGATRWLSPNKALIMLSLRYKTDDHLWFTFFHEAAHILLHGKREVFIEDDDEVGEEMQQKEEEADHFAADFLIPPDALEAFHPRGEHISHEDILEFSSWLGIAPGIVVGRLQHDGIVPPQNFNRLKKKILLRN